MKQSMDIILLLEAWKGDNFTRRIGKLDLSNAEADDIKEIVKWLPRAHTKYWTEENEAELQSVLDVHTAFALEDLYKLTLMEVKAALDACGEVPFSDNVFKDTGENDLRIYFKLALHVNWENASE
jgi:hypothetical protein